MESRNVKIIDEHGIDRDGRIVCGLKVDNSDYVLYSIERDGENNNLFVSKVMNNFDGTSNMVNIEDESEKTKLNSIVKEMVTYAINNEAEKTTETVNLPSGTVVTIEPLLFNKEQNINVSKTYITTVKKSVTKVGEDYFDMPAPAPVKQDPTFFDTVKNDIFSDNTTPVPEASVPEATPVVEPVLPVPPVVPETPGVAPTPVAAEAPVLPTEPVAVSPAPAVEPIFDVAPAAAPANNGLVFDGSKETNLNQALGEISDANTVPVDNVAPLREFGQSDVVPAAPMAAPAADVPPVPNSGGFANKKFFMVIAILFFIAACVFLGYEAFMYFQLTK